MLLKDCKLGDKIIVYIGSDGLIYHAGQAKLNLKAYLPIKTTVIGTFTDGIMNGRRDGLLGWDNTRPIRPNASKPNFAYTMIPNTMIPTGYAYIKNYHLAYHWSMWFSGNLEVDMPSYATSTATAIKKPKYHNDTCPCGIILTLHVCDYHAL